MRRTVAIIVTLLLVLGVLVALNAASYVRVEAVRDSELTPDRSTFNSGPTGTRALFDFLRESDHQVIRWRESPTELLSATGPKPATLVIVGRTRVPVSEDEASALLRWVNRGGRLVIVDRQPDYQLLPASGQWTISTKVFRYPQDDTDPADFEQMTTGMKPIGPMQPTALALEVDSILPSRFAGSVTIAPKTPAKPGSKGEQSDQQGPGGGSVDPSEDSESSGEPESSETPPPARVPRRAIVVNDESESIKSTDSPGPVVHFATERGALLVDFPHGKGRIVVLSDPFICTNNGINRADNLQLAINVVAGSGGLIAFDEFHQGRASTHNALIEYFSGTPILALCGQLALLALMIVWSRGRRFARPMPLPQLDRRSSLEFVASMAELQQRARAYDLALENIYARVRRVLVRYAGSSNSSTRAAIATRVAARSSLNRQELETLMRNCEDVINGAPANMRRSLDLARSLRQVEAALGLRMRSREARQAAEKG